MFTPELSNVITLYARLKSPNRDVIVQFPYEH